jgi:hypothetical protein
VAQTTTPIAATLTALLLSASLALAQQSPTPKPSQESISVPASEDDQALTSNWPTASLVVASKRRFFVVTSAQPNHRRACQVQSVTPDQLVCKAGFGATRIYKPQEIIALTTPGDNDVRLRFVIGLNAAAGLAAWGTYVLAPTCLPCAIATGVLAAALFFSIGAILMADGQPETILYLSAGRQHPIALVH